MMLSLPDAIYRDRIQRAREIPPAAKLAAGWTLFVEVCERMRGGIRGRNPAASDKEIENILAQQLTRLRKIEEHGIYQKVAS
jgi:hypothetical protein